MKKYMLFLVALSIGLTGCMPLYQEQGYSSEADYKFSQSLKNSTPQRINALKSYGISSREEFDNLIAEMKSSNYADNTNWDTVFLYLKDRNDAKAANVSVIKQRDARLAAEKQKNIEHAKNFPYVAILSCEINGKNVRNFSICLSGKHTVHSELKLTNGSDDMVYKRHEMRRVGVEQQDGLHIQLRRSFAISAQNASSNYILRLKIVEVATGKVIRNQAAGEWGFVRFNMNN